MAELDIRGILEELNRADVEYLVIGGVAVGFHGYVRASTKESSRIRWTLKPLRLVETGF